VNPTVSRVRGEITTGPEALGLSEGEFDALVDRLIQRERERVADAVDVSLDTVTTTETLSRPEHVAPAYLPLPDRPVQSVSSVTLDSERIGGPAVTADQYLVTDTHNCDLGPTASDGRLHVGALRSHGRMATQSPRYHSR
jgi:hypothetical protein